MRSTRVETARVRAAMGEVPLAVRAASPGTRAVPAVGGEVLRDEDDLAERRGAVGMRARTASTSARISSAERDRCLPRKEGMAQKPQMRSHPSATFTYAQGARAAGRGSSRRSNWLVAPARPVGGAAGGERHGHRGRPGGGWLRVGSDQLVPETRHEVHLGQRVTELVAVALGHAAGHDEAGAGPAPVGEVQDGLDRLLAGGLNEGARVHDDEVGAGRDPPRGGTRARQGALRVCRSPPGSSGTPGSAASRDPRLRTLSSHQAGSRRRSDGARQARRGGPTFRIVRHQVPDPRAEREGFEPSDPVTQVNSLAVSPIRPLSHLSSRTFAFRRTGLSITCP